ncbi:hypothetical protein P3342_009523 [Pyrenophora teres f. teres]|uniref:DnaJ n=1 Tax=Pyrenophora teres f. teres TaxID=97479 RepID=A0A6S6W882_9PLEO|nr:hypothetical protein HRS9139_08840 [Pyrenophora teres f. teres]KAE8834827.1 hypothetical protein PTNB85_06160 [Pyrenophora teres f. teres]KAE8843695.1 hypothetical protein HRS9122_04798 [Pyrenophora teres f. teres]KAE8859247.1 hypothetical protein PTNB73_08727 [Pyrenophora teres f. teres]KAE8861115.1 hypothetical protein PTNB29_06210 [Pyrenophora teres f. teres]
MSYASHYDNLKMSHSASSSGIDAAHRLVLSDNHPDKVRQLGPFARILAERRVRSAIAALEVLSNPTRRRHYDKELDYKSEKQDSWRRRYAGFTPQKPTATPKGMDGSPDPSSEDRHTDEGNRDVDDEANDPNCLPEDLEAAYRYGSTPVATDVDVAIRGWRIRMRISSKFRFLDDLTDLTDPIDGSQEVSFEIGLQRAREVRSNPQDVITELILDIEDNPSNQRIGLQTILRESTPSSCSLVVNIVANHGVPQKMPWNFGLDFEMNHLVKGSLKRCTCIRFSVDEPAEQLQTGQGLNTSECVLRWDKALKANKFHNLGAARVGICGYGDVEMWRLSAVGYRAGS